MNFQFSKPVASIVIMYTLSCASKLDFVKSVERKIIKVQEKSNKMNKNGVLKNISATEN